MKNEYDKGAGLFFYLMATSVIAALVFILYQVIKLGG